MLRNGERGYGPVSILLHWTVALLFFVQLPLGYMTQAVGNRPTLQLDLLQWHKSVGMLILALAGPRLVWAVLAGRPRLPDALTPSERAAAHGARILLYAATILVPLAGWATASAVVPASPVSVFGFLAMPMLPLPASNAAEAIWSSVHAFLAYGAGFLVVVHTLAALRHHFHFGDDVLMRMIRPDRRKSP